MKLLFTLLVAFSASLGAQETKKKPVAKKQQTAHTKASPEQIRKFNQMQEKQKK